MNYRTVIAFLGTQQQKDWAKPLSGWVRIEGGRAWNENMPVERLRGITQRFSAKEHPQLFENFYGCWQDADGLNKLGDYRMDPDTDCPQFYNADTKSIIFLVDKKLLKDADVIFDFIDKHGPEMAIDKPYNYEKPFVKKAFLGREQQKMWATNVLNTRGYENYTPEIVAELNEMGYDVRKTSTSVIWYLDGELHRVNGPAFEGYDGAEQWCLNGKIHRADGPAIVYGNGRKRWYLNDEEYTEEEYNKAVHEL